MVRVTALASPLLLGFDDLERALDKVSKTGTDGYPPYNIERIAAVGSDPEKLRITLAVAGFSHDQIEVTVEETSSRSAAGSRGTKHGSICIGASPPGSSSAAFFSRTGCRSRAPNSRKGC